MADKSIKIQFKADTDALRAGLSQADNDIKSFGDKIGEWSKKAAAAFAVVAAAAAAYAGKLAIDGVKAAIADEAAQLKLATTLRNVAGATDAAIASTEDFILQLSLATGVADDNLRPALDRLVRSGLSVTDAQKALTVALDVSAGTGKGLEAVANALGKAYEGNTQSLARLGLGLSSTELKAMDFDGIMQVLSSTFKDQATLQADTFQGKMARIRVGFDEAKESLGTALLPVIEQFADYLLTTVIPAVQKWLDENGPKLVKVLREDVIPTIGAVVEKLATIVEWVIDNKEAISTIGTILLAGLAAAKVTSTIATIVTALGTLTAAYTATATAATAAGTATSGAAAAAATAAGAGAGFAALASRLTPLIAVLTALVVAFEKIATNPKIRALVENKDIENVLPGLGTGGLGGGSGTTAAPPTRTATPTPTTRIPVYTSNPNLKGLRGYTPKGVPILDIPELPTTLDTPKTVKPDPMVAKIEETLDELRVSRYQVDETLKRIDQVAAAQLAQMDFYDRASVAPTINFNAPVVSDPEAIARLVDEALTGSANRTGNYTSLGFSTTSLPAAAI